MTVTLSRSKMDCTIATPRRGFGARIADMIAINRQRRALKNLDEHMLRDIGITHIDALTEAEKPVWDVPAYWMK
jgi:uncharacterized protein YjiS (DUF1127 family)